MNRYASLGKRDANEKPIVDALREVGCEVVSGTDVDLFVKRGDLAKLMEVKVPGAIHLTELQKKLAAMFRDQYVVVQTVDEALKAVGVRT